jgi:hypothetical protein
VVAGYLSRSNTSLIKEDRIKTETLMYSPVKCKNSLWIVRSTLGKFMQNNINSVRARIQVSNTVDTWSALALGYTHELALGFNPFQMKGLVCFC